MRQRAITNMRNRLDLWRDGDSATLYLREEELPVLRSILAEAEADAGQAD